ncbi:hypothetical protein DF107_10720 [Burkholderia stagnalis]|uniref:Uncharacterized protein n=1 Tax=Burkholderia stagnalis TaxID=1503054 RepID=A0A6L3MNT9_9BURK|nr:hypothetical protein F7R25_29805 [Burkholderia stagnalis]RQQ13573.1 hypothetical protein DF164_05605 [Burkholderia stagnalis]RQQ17959.1 hypothetical protein DF161_10895 [Burkholderia stagnalis]RQQ21131.1 hypothetical protein DF163_32465 [Burkholderia stagnalis]RQQ23018.1 hypothetical protein DF149_31640 [Burkholderia stagnalis]
MRETAGAHGCARILIGARAAQPRDNLTHDKSCNDDLSHLLIFDKSYRRKMRPLSWIECASGVDGFNDNQAV